MNLNMGFVAYKTTHPSGVDKIILHSKEFEVKSTDYLQIELNPFIGIAIRRPKTEGEKYVECTPLFFCKNSIYADKDGLVYGKKAFHNATSEMGNLSLNIDFRGCKIIYNPSKFLGKYSGELATPEEAYNITAIIEKYLAGIGIITNLSNYKLTRIDIAKDREMSDLFFTYKPAIALLRSDRQKMRLEYEGGITFGNKQRQDCFYDKGYEIAPEKGNTNLMRSEYRLLTSNAINPEKQKDTTLNISNFMQLKDISPKDISDIHNKHIMKDLFKIKTPDQESFSFMGDVALLKTFKDQGKRNAVMEWVMLMGISNLVETRGIDGIKLILETAGFDRSYIYRCMLKINSMVHRSAFLQDAPTISAKYEEIRQRFVA